VKREHPKSRRLVAELRRVGPYLEDRTTMAFAALIEREFGGFTPPPGYAH